MELFTDAYIGERVYDYAKGEYGKISKINRRCLFPVKVKFEDGTEEYYASNGTRKSIGSDVQILFWDKPTVSAPERNIELREFFKILKKKDFVHGEKNNFLTYNDGYVYSDYIFYSHVIGVTYFTEESISAFILMLRKHDKTFTRDEFIGEFNKFFNEEKED